MADPGKLPQLLRRLTEAAKNIDYDRIARAFDAIWHISMGGIRGAREGNLVEVGSATSATLDRVVDILDALGERALADKVDDLVFRVKEATFPEVPPEEELPEEGRRRLKEQAGPGEDDPVGARWDSRDPWARLEVLRDAGFEFDQACRVARMRWEDIPERIRRRIR